jgi:chorismate synthase
VKQIGSIRLNRDFNSIDKQLLEKSPVRCPDDDISIRMVKMIEELKRSGDTTGGTVRCVVKGVPVGLGEPVFDKLQASLARGVMSINAAKGFEYGSGFRASEMLGSVHNDEFFVSDENIDSTINNRVKTKTNYSGGIQGGISNGEDIYFNVAFKPVSSLGIEQNSIDMEGNAVKVHSKGRHDVCIAPRAVPVVEAMTAMVILDHLLIYKAYKVK